MITFSQLGNQGRLGNQLWQIAATIAHAKKHNVPFQFPQWSYESHFNLHGCFGNIKVNRVYAESHFHYSEIPFWGDMDLSGYFQSYKYFENCKEDIDNLLTPASQFDKEMGLCSIHIRRTDYVHQPQNHPTQNMKYYEYAMQLSNCSKFLIFSDDIIWCKNNFKGNQFEFSEGNSPAIDLALMAKKCENNIICNSSFSWWGAYLNQNINKKVIAPNLWFGSNLNHNIKDLLPIQWVKI